MAPGRNTTAECHQLKYREEDTAKAISRSLLIRRFEEDGNENSEAPRQNDPDYGGPKAGFPKRCVVVAHDGSSFDKATNLLKRFFFGG